MLFIYFLLLPHCLLGFCVWSLFCYAVLSVLSSFAIVLMRKRERESKLLCLNCIPGVLCVFVLYDFSSRCYGLVYSV